MFLSLEGSFSDLKKSYGTFEHVSKSSRNVLSILPKSKSLFYHTKKADTYLCSIDVYVYAGGKELRVNLCKGAHIPIPVLHPLPPWLAEIHVSQM